MAGKIVELTPERSKELDEWVIKTFNQFQNTYPKFLELITQKSLVEYDESFGDYRHAFTHSYEPFKGIKVTLQVEYCVNIQDQFVFVVTEDNNGKKNTHHLTDTVFHKSAFKAIGKVLDLYVERFGTKGKHYLLFYKPYEAYRTWINAHANEIKQMQLPVITDSLPVKLPVNEKELPVKNPVNEFAYHFNEEQLVYLANSGSSGIDWITNTLLPFIKLGKQNQAIYFTKVAGTGSVFRCTYCDGIIEHDDESFLVHNNSDLFYLYCNECGEKRYTDIFSATPIQELATQQELPPAPGSNFRERYNNKKMLKRMIHQFEGLSYDRRQYFIKSLVILFK